MIRLEVGRKQNFLTINDTSVSGLHAYIYVKDNNILLIDCNSTNGSYVFSENGWNKISRLQLRPNQRLRFGNFETTSNAIRERVLNYLGEMAELMINKEPCCEKSESISTPEPELSQKPKEAKETPKKVEKKEKNNKVMRDEYGNIIQAKG